MKLFSKLLLAGGILAVAEGFDRRLEVTHWDLDFQNLPAEFDGFRIAHISDLHSESAPCLARAIADGKPDIIVITGDITQTDLPSGKQSGLLQALEVLDGIPEIAIVRLGKGDVVRNDLVQTVVKAYEAYERKGGKA